MTHLLPMLSEGFWLVFTAIALFAALAGAFAFPYPEWKGVETGEPYTKYLRTWWRTRPWFAVLWTLLMLVVIIGGVWLLYHVTVECLVKPGGIGCDA